MNYIITGLVSPLFLVRLIRLFHELEIFIEPRLDPLFNQSDRFLSDRAVYWSEGLVSWDSFLYQYIIGGIIFLAGFILAWRSGDFSWKKREDRLTAVFLAILFLAYFAGHGFWQSCALGGQ